MRSVRRLGTAGIRGIAISVALALVLAACGGSSKKSTSSATSTAVASTPSTTSASSTTTTTSRPKSKPAKSKPQKKTTTTHTTTSTTHTTATSTTTTQAYTRPMHATLVGENHHPIVNKHWPYTVTVTDAKGRPLSGTVDIQFTFNGVVVGHDTPPSHPIKDGRWHDNLTFPPQSIGQPINLQAVVHTALGSVTLNWAIKVRK